MPWRASSLSFVAQNANQPLDNSHSIRTPVAFRSHAGRIPVAVGRYDAPISSTKGGTNARIRSTWQPRPHTAPRNRRVTSVVAFRSHSRDGLVTLPRYDAPDSSTTGGTDA